MADINARSVEEVLSNYDFRATQKGFKPYYEVKAVGQIKFYHTEDDIVNGRETLEQCLNSQKYCGNTSVFTIMYFTRLDKNGECTGKSSSINVRLNEPGGYLPEHKGADLMTMQLLKEIKELQMVQDSRLKALEEDEEEEEEEDNTLMGKIGKIWQGMPQNMQTAAIMGIMKKLGLLEIPQPSINGVPEEDTITDTKTESEKIRTALQILSTATPTLGEDLMKLANIAKTNPSQFNMLLQMLRGM